jgi:hypothetical protein
MMPIPRKKRKTDDMHMNDYSTVLLLSNSSSGLLCALIRFRHFEELHRRLKEYPQYSLHLPPKHFLSSGLEVPVVRERCKLLDIYLKVYFFALFEYTFFSYHFLLKFEYWH